MFDMIMQVVQRLEYSVGRKPDTMGMCARRCTAALAALSLLVVRDHADLHELRMRTLCLFRESSRAARSLHHALFVELPCPTRGMLLLMLSEGWAHACRPSMRRAITSAARLFLQHSTRTGC